MKKKQFIICFLLLLFTCNFCIAQQSEDRVLRDLENAEREAILKGDTLTLIKLLSPEIVVQNPENTIVRIDQVIERIKNGKINYTSFERLIENISFVENIGIVMGKEIITPNGITTHAGKIVTRRFTNIWIKKDDTWKLAARQATIISIK